MGEIKTMINIGAKVLFDVNWTSRKEKETIGEVVEIKNGLFTVFAHGNYFFKEESEINLIKSYKEKGAHKNE
jgi:hypothetical protein